MNLQTIAGKLGTKFHKPIQVMSKYAPEICLVAGTGLVIAGTVKVVLGTIKAKEVINEAQDTDEIINNALERNDEHYTEEDAKQDKITNTVQTSFKIAKSVVPGVIMGVGGIALIVKGHNILNTRFVGAAAAYKLAEKTLTEYRARVVEEYGEDVDRKFRYGVVEETTTTEKTGKDGKTKTVEEVKLNLDPKSTNPYIRIFDELNPKFSVGSPEYNMVFLKQTQAMLNLRLDQMGHVFLNEVYDALGFDRTPAGAVIGWLKNSDEGDGFIDLGIMRLIDDFDRSKRDFINGLEEAIVLEFNVDPGVIYDQI